MIYEGPMGKFTKREKLSLWTIFNYIWGNFFNLYLSSFHISCGGKFFIYGLGLNFRSSEKGRNSLACRSFRNRSFEKRYWFKNMLLLIWGQIETCKILKYLNLLLELDVCFVYKDTFNLGMSGVIRCGLVSAQRNETRNFIRDRYRDFFWDQIFSIPMPGLFQEQIFSRPRLRLFLH